MQIVITALPENHLLYTLCITHCAGTLSDSHFYNTFFSESLLFLHCAQPVSPWILYNLQVPHKFYRRIQTKDSLPPSSVSIIVYLYVQYITVVGIKYFSLKVYWNHTLVTNGWQLCHGSSTFQQSDISADSWGFFVLLLKGSLKLWEWKSCVFSLFFVSASLHSFSSFLLFKLKQKK